MSLRVQALYLQGTNNPSSRCLRAKSSQKGQRAICCQTLNPRAFPWNDCAAQTLVEKTLVVELGTPYWVAEVAPCCVEVTLMLKSVIAIADNVR